MKKLILSFAIVAMATLSVSAQDAASKKDLTFSVGAEVGVPTASGGANLVFGGSVQGEYAVAEQIGVTLNAGYLVTSPSSGDGAIPVLAGARYYFNENFYGSAQVGLTFQGGASNFTYAPGVGYKVSENFDVLVKYQAVSVPSVSVPGFGSVGGGTAGNIMLRAAYSF